MAPKRSRDSSEDCDDSASSDTEDHRSPRLHTPQTPTNGSSGRTTHRAAPVTKPQLLPLLRCRLCIKPDDLLFPAQLVNPVTLPCGHSVCSSHLPSLLESTSKTSSAMTTPCPVAGCVANLPSASQKSRPAKYHGSAVTIYHPLQPRLDAQAGLRIDSLKLVKSDIKLEQLLQLLASAPESWADDVPSDPKEHQPSSRPAKRPRTLLTSRAFIKSLKEILHCEVCFMLYFEPLTLSCGHTFCAKCIQRTIDRDSKCPLCRSPLGADVCLALNLLDVEEREPPTNKVLVGTLLLTFGAEYISRRDTIIREAELAHAGGFDTPISFVTECIFPGMRTRLTFASSDQRLMLRRILSTPDARLGTVLASSTLGPADDAPSSYGTLVGVKSVQFIPENVAIAEVEGTPIRFRLLDSHVIDGYTAAKVERIEDLEDLDWTKSSLPTPLSLNDHESEPSVDEMIEFCRNFIEEMGTETAPWVVKKYNDEYGPPPLDDAAAFGWWCASHLPISHQDKFKLLPIRSPRLRLQLLCHWISTLGQQWWYSRGCIIC